MENKPLKRYPGSQPFAKEQSRVFFGRELDIVNLYQTISINDLTVLHGKSGLGKTSLLNAGVVPKFTEASLIALFPRFYAYSQKEHSSPLKGILAHLRFYSTDPSTKQETVFLSTVQPDPEKQTLWQLFKSIQWHQRSGLPGLVVVFDQFEEIFSYPEAEVQEFIRQFADLLDNKMPAPFREMFYKNLPAIKSTPEGAEQINFIHQSLPLKIVLGIRSDRLSLLERIAPYYSNILKNRYELNPLNRAQAQEAILRPASEPGLFATPSFRYSGDTLEAILNFLTEQNTKPVETTQLQVICQYVENNLVQREGQEIQLAELGDIKSIYKNYYDSIIASLLEEDQHKVRFMIEDGMIFEQELRRLSLFEGQILNNYQVEAQTLARLVNEHHLLRVDMHPSGSFVYEISHDSLVEPILDAKKLRVAEELEKAQTAEAIENRRREAEAERQERIRRERVAYFYRSIAGFGLAVIALGLAGLAFFQKRDLQKQQIDLQMARQASDSLMRVAQLQRDSAKGLAIELQSAKDTILAQNYVQHYQQGKLYLDQKQYKGAMNEFAQCLAIDTPRRNAPELHALIEQCREGAVKFEKFEQLISSAENHRAERNYIEAHKLYGQAKALDIDVEKAKQGIELCERDMREDLKDLLRRANTFLEKGQDCGWASRIIQEKIDPILAVLPEKTSVERDRIWGKCHNTQK